MIEKTRAVRRCSKAIHEIAQRLNSRHCGKIDASYRYGRIRYVELGHSVGIHKRLFVRISTPRLFTGHYRAFKAQVSPACRVPKRGLHTLAKFYLLRTGKRHCVGYVGPRQKLPATSELSSSYLEYLAICDMVPRPGFPYSLPQPNIISPPPQYLPLFTSSPRS